MPKGRNNIKTEKMKITKEQLIKLSEIRKELIKNFDKRELTEFGTIKDLDTIIESILSL